MTLERLALEQKKKRFPQLRRKGFSAAVRAAFQREEPWDDAPPSVRVVPESWFEEPAGYFTCVEVEDWHRLSREKLMRYGQLFVRLDGCDNPDYSLRLFVFDRYGQNERKLPLGEFYLESIIEMYCPKDVE
jgi:hypothetical protein